MTYESTAKHQTAYQTILFVILIQALGDTEHSALVLLEVLLCLLLVATIFIQYTLKISKNGLSYHITLFSISIYKKELPAVQIQKIIFKRYGWSTRGAVIQMEKGLNIRIIAFRPVKVYENLVKFAGANNISMSKSNDYQILEKLKPRKAMDYE
ncbi:hypothetical protein [Virgibacillus oceani]|uniref:Uncharacterized protein n=1 Tax=Virgibacillus oceani TaxID=1479511 RepID=A0A917HME1_9BACI|nr:hypothetical protein [Virgibacillus oceani]GGG83643.1 hypothetical protein GCM10011398_31510 [Virgibacillus oceani]